MTIEKQIDLIYEKLYTIFSDLQGVLRMQFNENISEKYIEIERELKSLGII